MTCPRPLDPQLQLHVSVGPLEITESDEWLPILTETTSNDLRPRGRCSRSIIQLDKTLLPHPDAPVTRNMSFRLPQNSRRCDSNHSQVYSALEARSFSNKRRSTWSFGESHSLIVCTSRLLSDKFAPVSLVTVNMFVRTTYFLSHENVPSNMTTARLLFAHGGGSKHRPGDHRHYEILW